MADGDLKQQIEVGATNKLAVTLKENYRGIALLLNANLPDAQKLPDPDKTPVSDAQIQQIAKDIVEGQTDQAKNVLNVLKTKMLDDPTIGSKLPADVKDQINSLVHLQSDIIPATEKSVNDNTGPIFGMSLLGGLKNGFMGLMQWMFGGFQGGFDGLKQIVASLAEKDTVNQFASELQAKGIDTSQGYGKTIVDQFEHQAQIKAGLIADDNTNTTPDLSAVKMLSLQEIAQKFGLGSAPSSPPANTGPAANPSPTTNPSTEAPAAAPQTNSTQTNPLPPGTTLPPNAALPPTVTGGPAANVPAPVLPPSTPNIVQSAPPVVPPGSRPAAPASAPKDPRLAPFVNKLINDTLVTNKATSAQIAQILPVAAPIALDVISKNPRADSRGLASAITEALMARNSNARELIIAMSKENARNSPIGDQSGMVNENTIKYGTDVKFLGVVQHVDGLITNIQNALNAPQVMATLHTLAASNVSLTASNVVQAPTGPNMVPGVGGFGAGVSVQT